MSDSLQESKDALLYELDGFKEKLDYELYQVNSQLESVNQRFRGLKHDILVHIIYFAIPIVLLILVQFIRSYNILADIFFMQVTSAIMGITMMVAPFFLFGLIRSIVKWSKHNAQRNWSFPTTRLSEKRIRKPEEENYWAEREKLCWILSQYRQYQTDILQMKEQIEQTDEVTTEALRTFIGNMRIYDQVTPARP